MYTKRSFFGDNVHNLVCHWN